MVFSLAERGMVYLISRMSFATFDLAPWYLDVWISFFTFMDLYENGFFIDGFLPTDYGEN